MIRIVYSPTFLRRLKKFSPAFRAEAVERIEEFQDVRSHQKLKVHKLHGAMQGLFAFSINYQDRIVFEWSKDKMEAYLLDIGDHSVYE